MKLNILWLMIVVGFITAIITKNNILTPLSMIMVPIVIIIIAEITDRFF